MTYNSDYILDNIFFYIFDICFKADELVKKKGILITTY